MFDSILSWLLDLWLTVKDWVVDNVVYGYHWAANWVSDKVPAEWWSEMNIAARLDAVTGSNMSVMSYWLPGFYAGLSTILYYLAICVVILLVRWGLSFIPASNQ